MSEQLHPGLHPDPDSLSAFMEGVLPEHERLQCLAHLAECPHCREVVFLAQEAPAPPAASTPVPARKRWLTPVPVLAAAALLVMAGLVTWLYLHRSAGTGGRDIVAGISQASPSRTPGSTPDQPVERPVPPLGHARTKPNQVPATPELTERPLNARRILSLPPRDTTTPTLPGPPPIATAQGTVPSEQSPLPPALQPALPSPPEPPQTEAAAALSAISGTVIDATGAVISGATIKVRQLDGTATIDARTDGTGQFHVTQLPPGRYELQIGAPGFRQFSKQLDVHSREVAVVKSQLQVGAVTETVEVTAAPSQVLSTNASVSATRSSKKAKAPEGPRPLPSTLPAGISVTSGKVTLATDSAGTVFLSRNSGKSWKAVKPVWDGKVRQISLADTPQTATAVFQLTTESGTTWLSRDGAHWYPAPPKH